MNFYGMETYLIGALAASVLYQSEVNQQLNVHFPQIFAPRQIDWLFISSFCCSNSANSLSPNVYTFRCPYLPFSQDSQQVRTVSFK